MGHIPPKVMCKYIITHSNEFQHVFSNIHLQLFLDMNSIHDILSKSSII